MDKKGTAMITFKQFINEGHSNLQPASRELNKVVDSNYRRSTEKQPKLQHVAISQMRYTQHKIKNQNIANIRQALKNPKHIHKVPAPYLIHHKGEYAVLDGHHRVEAHKRNGATHIWSHVIDHDSE